MPPPIASAATPAPDPAVIPTRAPAPAFRVHPYVGVACRGDGAYRGVVQSVRLAPMTVFPVMRDVYLEPDGRFIEVSHYTDFEHMQPGHASESAGCVPAASVAPLFARIEAALPTLPPQDGGSAARVRPASSPDGGDRECVTEIALVGGVTWRAAVDWSSVDQLSCALAPIATAMLKPLERRAPGSDPPREPQPRDEGRCTGPATAWCRVELRAVPADEPGHARYPDLVVALDRNGALRCAPGTAEFFELAPDDAARVIDWLMADVPAAREPATGAPVYSHERRHAQARVTTVGAGASVYDDVLRPRELATLRARWSALARFMPARCGTP
jgi:hypothetical protein